MSFGFKRCFFYWLFFGMSLVVRAQQIDRYGTLRQPSGEMELIDESKNIIKLQRAQHIKLLVHILLGMARVAAERQGSRPRSLLPDAPNYQVYVVGSGLKFLSLPIKKISQRRGIIYDEDIKLIKITNPQRLALDLGLSNNGVGFFVKF